MSAKRLNSELFILGRLSRFRSSLFASPVSDFPYNGKAGIQIDELTMLIDIRIYQCKPGMREEFFELYEKYGRGPQTRILGEPYSL